MINRETFQATKDNEGTVEVTIAGETKRVSATIFQGKITAYGFVCKYRTGAKLWNAMIMQYANGKESFMGGFESRSGKHRQIDQVWFKPNR